MTLIVDGDSGFNDQVVTALGEICPCSKVTLDGNGKISLGKGPSFCDCYCHHSAGCNLVTQLVDAGAEFRIKLSLGNSAYEEAGDNVVTWAPDDDLGGVDACGGTQPPPAAFLAHELTHAWLELNKKSHTDENLAVRGENQVRAEMCEPLRVTYKTGPGEPQVPGYDQPVLDDTDHEVCSCDTRRATCRSWLRRLVCRIAVRVRCWINGVLRLVQPRPQPLQPPSPIPFADYGDAGDVYVVQRYRAALRTRTGARHRAHVDALRARFDGATDGVHLEAVGVVGGYRIIWSVDEEHDTTVVTNLRVDGGPTGPFARGPGDLVEYRVANRLSAVPVAPALGRLAFNSGLGGNPRASDGMVQMLWVKSPGRELHTALYGYGYPAFHGVSRSPENPDRPRWEAIVAIHALWRELMRDAEPVRVIARAQRP